MKHRRRKGFEIVPTALTCVVISGVLVVLSHFVVERRKSLKEFQSIQQSIHEKHRSHKKGIDKKNAFFGRKKRHPVYTEFGP